VKIMQRPANNDFEAFLTAQAMEDAGANVFSITFNGRHRQHGAMEDVSKMIVWAKVQSEDEIDKVDREIEKALAKLG